MAHSIHVREKHLAAQRVLSTLTQRVKGCGVLSAQTARLLCKMDQNTQGNVWHVRQATIAFRFLSLYHVQVEHIIKVCKSSVLHAP